MAGKTTVQPDFAAFCTADGWNPQDTGPGASVEGTVVYLTQIEGNWGPYPVLTVNTPDGPVNVHAFHHVLLKQLTALKPGVGDRVRITYHGCIEKEGKNPYHKYSAINPDKPQEASTPEALWGTDKTDADF